MVNHRLRVFIGSVIAGVVLFASGLPSFAQIALLDDITETTISAGWGKASVKHLSDDYEILPVLAQFCYDAESFFQVDLPGQLRSFIEPGFSYVYSPSDNLELVLGVGFRYNTPIVKRCRLYAELGVGGVYSTQHIARQSTQLNFQDFYGAGVQFLFADDKAFNIGYRYRHSSNAEIKQPNNGINTNTVLCGITFFY